MAKREQQVTVPLPDSLREYVQRRAAVEDRSIASVVRRLIDEAARREEHERAASA